MCRCHCHCQDVLLQCHEGSIGLSRDSSSCKRGVVDLELAELEARLDGAREQAHVVGGRAAQLT